MGKVVIRGEAARQRVIEILMNGGSLDDAANETGFGRNYCRQLGAKAGIRFTYKYDIEKIEQLANSGATVYSISESTGYPVAAIKYHCKRLGIKLKKQLTNRQLSVKTLREQNKCCVEIADLTGIPNSEVRQVAIAIGMPFTEEEKQRSIQLGLEKGYKNHYRINAKERKCKQCGKPFFGDILYCSTECQNRAKNSSHAKAIKRANIIDNTITLDKLYRRDKGICWICGGMCDYEDNRVNERGFFIVGKMYPSIDHVYPLSKGGDHTWGNVKLAHHYCNTLKNDKVVS